MARNQLCAAVTLYFVLGYCLVLVASGKPVSAFCAAGCAWVLVSAWKKTQL